MWLENPLGSQGLEGLGTSFQSRDAVVLVCTAAADQSARSVRQLAHLLLAPGVVTCRTGASRASALLVRGHGLSD